MPVFPLLGKGQAKDSFTAVLSALEHKMKGCFFHSAAEVCFTSGNSLFAHLYVSQKRSICRISKSFSQCLRFYMNGSQTQMCLAWRFSCSFLHQEQNCKLSI